MARCQERLQRQPIPNRAMPLAQDGDVVFGKQMRLIPCSGVMVWGSSDQSADQGAEERLSSSARVMDELEEPKIDREFLL
jgi:hypothetical protein